VKHPFLFIMVPALAVVLLSTLELMYEAEPLNARYIAIEMAETAVLVVLVMAVAWSVLRVAQIKDNQQAYRDYLARSSEQGADWRAARSDEIAALSDAIALEFRAWGLTDTEMNVAELLLKGASVKVIALDQKTSVAIIRKSADSIYQKGGLSGRLALSTYFLDGLFSEFNAKQTAPLQPLDA
jgi:DNA-binding NarL/FixJ family response regulator